MGGGGIIGAAIQAFAFVYLGPAAFTWAAFGKAFAVMVVLGAVSRATAKKPSAGGATMAAQGRMETIRQPLGPWQIIFGRCRVGGVLTYFETSTDNQTAHMIVTYSGHPVNNLRDVYFNGESTLDYGTSTAGGRFTGYSTIYRSLGTEGAAQPFAALVSAGLSWASTDLQRERSKVYTSHTFSNEVWQTGLPVESAIIDGVKDIYDPRLGSPSVNQWTNNPALCIAHYLTASYGLDADYATEIDEDQLIAAANICDERVLLVGTVASTISGVDATNDWFQLNTGMQHVDYGDGIQFSLPSSPVGALPAGLSTGVTYYAIPIYEGDTTNGQVFRVATSHANAIAGVYIALSDTGTLPISITFYDEPRYRLNGAFSLSEKPMVVLERMLSAMAGSLIQAGGVWYIRAGAYTVPTLSLDEDDFAGDIQIQTNLSRTSSANAVKGSFVSPTNRYQPIDFPSVLSQTYFEEDGGERVWRDLDLTAFVTSSTQAQRLAKIDLVYSRVGMTARARFKLSAFRMMTGSTVSVTHAQLGWSAKVFEVLSCTLIIEQDGRIEVEAMLKESASEIYDWSVSDEQLADVAPNTNLPDPTSIDAPTGLTFTQSAALPNRGTLSWTASPDYFIKEYQVEYKLTLDVTYTVVPVTTSNSIRLEKLVPGRYDFRVKAVNTFGSVSSYATAQGDVYAYTTTSDYSGIGSLGVTKRLSLATITSNPVVSAMAFCPINGRVYGAAEGGKSFSFLPNPTSPAFSAETITALSGYDIIGCCYDPISQLMIFCRAHPGGVAPAVIFGISPLDHSLVFTGTGSSSSAQDPKKVAHCPGDEKLWVSCQASSSVLIYSTTGSPDTRGADAALALGVSDTPRDMAYNPTANEMWVGHASESKISIFSLTGSPTYNRSILSTSGNVKGLLYCPSIDRMVASVRSNTGVVFYHPTTRAVTNTVTYGSPDIGEDFLLYCARNDRIYATSINDGKILTISPSSFISYESDLQIAGKLQDGTFCPSNNFLYFGSDSGKVAVVST